MSRQSPPELLVLHAVRILGFADTPIVGGRFGIEVAETAELLSDAEAHGWVSHASFGDLAGWSLTDAGRAENERQLALELNRAGGAAEVGDVHRTFLPLNGRLQRACTDWQVRPAGPDRLATNDHTDRGWDDRVLAELATLAADLPPLIGRLSSVLTRFGGYDSRFTAALDRARCGELEWVTGTTTDSCHRVWFELHEDLVATLGIDRGSESAMS